MSEYPSGDEDRDTLIELLCDEWPLERCYLDWDDRVVVVLRLLDVLDRNRLTVIDLGEPVTADDLRFLLRGRGSEAEAAGAPSASGDVEAIPSTPQEETT